MGVIDFLYVTTCVSLRHLVEYDGNLNGMESLLCGGSRSTQGGFPAANQQAVLTMTLGHSEPTYCGIRRIHAV